MGIKHLSSWFMRTLPQDAIKRIDVLNPVHSLAIDLNDTLHRAMNQVKDCENRFYKRVIAILTELIESTRPHNSIGIFMDGVAPSAKLLLQIKRRRSSPPDSMLTAPLFSSLAITPGTPAMRLLADEIRTKICSRGHNIHFSCSDEPGEGEVKIVKWLKTIPKQAVGNVLVFGADADFLPIGCVQQRLHSSRICLDMPNYQTAPIYGFNRFLSNETNIKQGRVEDIGILLMMLGNDYLPKLAGGVSPDVAIAAYRATGFPYLVQINRETGMASLHRDNMIQLFEYLYSELHPKDKRKCVNAKCSESPDLENESGSNEVEIKTFFEGIAWMATMYYTGECPDYTFRLPKRNSTISFPKCLEWLKNSSPEKIISPVSTESPLGTDLAQLVMMPLWGRGMVQPHLQPIMDPDSELGYFFHHPCHICAGYRGVIRSFQDSAMFDNSPESAEFRRNISIEHALHMHEAHASIWNSPPVTEIRSQLNLMSRSDR